MKLLDVGTLTEDLPDHGLARGQVGAIVAEFAGAFEVEFIDDDERTTAIAALRREQFEVWRTL